MLLSHYPSQESYSNSLPNLIDYSADLIVGNHNTFAKHKVDLLDHRQVRDVLEYFVMVFSVGSCIIKWDVIDRIVVNFVNSTIVVYGKHNAAPRPYYPTV